MLSVVINRCGIEVYPFGSIGVNVVYQIICPQDRIIHDEANLGLGSINTYACRKQYASRLFVYLCIHTSFSIGDIGGIGSSGMLHQGAMNTKRAAGERVDASVTIC